MKMLVLAVFLLLSAPLFAQANLSSNQSQLSQFAHYLVPKGQNYTVENFTMKNLSAQAIVSNGQVYAFVQPGLLGPSVLTQDDEIQFALYHYYLHQGYSPDALKKLSIVHAGMESISTKHRVGEDKCRILTGTDRHECVDFDSCQKACYSVTSFCLPIALGAARPFINTILEFENSSRNLEAAYRAENASYYALVENSSLNNTLGYLDAVSGVNRAATKAYYNQLYFGYSYCFQPEYSLPIITSLQNLAQSSYANVSPLLALEDGASKIQNRTASGLLRLSLSEDPPSGDNVTQNQTVQNLTNSTLPPFLGNNTTSPQSVPEPSQPGENNAVPIVAVAGLAVLLGGVLFFIFRKKDGGTRDYSEAIEEGFGSKEPPKP